MLFVLHAYPVDSGRNYGSCGVIPEFPHIEGEKNGVYLPMVHLIVTIGRIGCIFQRNQAADFTQVSNRGMTPFAKSSAC